MRNVQRVVLTGFSGSGKSTVALLLAAKLGWRPIDIDQDIEIEADLLIPEIFARDGEVAFRELERRHLVHALDAKRVIIATGGGAVANDEVWTDELLRHDGTLVISLDARPDEMLQRMRAQAELVGEGTERPMLAGEDPLRRIDDLKTKRQGFYDRADITLISDRISAQAVADEIAPMVRPSLLEPRARLIAASGSSDIHIGPGAIDYAGELIRKRYPKAQRAWIISDANVDAIHGSSVETTLLGAGLHPQRLAVAAGESSKSFATLGLLHDWLLNGGVERGDVVVALGGGVIGDLAGFAAATVLRGIGLVQIPTTLLSMVDSSIGGKTGINHATGKNLIGAFYQPPLVIIDTFFLATLPPRELRSGFGEIVKHAIIQPSTPGGDRADLQRFLERNSKGLRNLHEPAISYLITRNIELKAAVVANDERETGIRAFLNFGHTLGHGIEAAGYQMLHGEAIAVGMRAAMRIGGAMGTASPPDIEYVDALINRFGLPAKAAVDRNRVMDLIESDKKKRAGKLRWVLPLNAGGVTISEDVPIEVARAALADVTE
ncbi:hypothetical protein BH09CHL1_BH09CHL1_31970 [soil metagenome]